MQELRTALLMRHAEALPAPPGTRDFDRVLSARGHADAAAVGGWLVRQGLRPARVLCSPALRARHTAEAVCRAIAGPSADTPVPECDTMLYLAELPVLVDLLERADAGTLLLIGHNPGLALLLEEYLPEFAARSGEDALMPPAALYALELRFSGSLLARRGHRVLAAVTPAQLAGGTAAST